MMKWNLTFAFSLAGLLVSATTSASPDIAPPPPAPSPAEMIPPAQAVAPVAPSAPPIRTLPAEADKRVVMDKAQILFDDGDTLVYGKEDIRILGMDTPEIIHKEHGFYEDQPFGREAALFTQKTVTEAKVVEYLSCGKDPYGRTLAHIFVDGELLSIRVIKAGLAYENISRYGDNGTPELAMLILQASKGLPKPAFEDPHTWRRSHKQKK